MTLDDNLIKEIELAYTKRFKFVSDSLSFENALKEYQELKDFAPDGNVSDVSDVGISDEAHFIMRCTTQHFIEQAFKAMKIDLTNPNVASDGAGNIGTPGRIAKVWCGFDIHDDTELGSGRWAEKPRLATFPNTHLDKFPITKQVTLTSNCSHHFLPFSSVFREDAKVIISYIPKDKVLGISKLQRLVDWVSNRFFLQEDLTRKIFEEIKDAAQTDDVFVGLFNIQHTCESLRGTKSIDGAFSSLYYDGEFKKTKIRNSVLGK